MMGDELDASSSTAGLQDEPLEEVAVGDGGGEAKDETSTDAHRVEVFDPRQHGAGRSRYTSYCILVRDVHDNQSKAAVRRRYSAFQWLYRHLQQERPGAIVPIIPHRKALSSDARFSDAIISYRREHGEIWINKIVSHPELRGAPCLLAFLGADDKIFATASDDGKNDGNGEGDEEEEDDDEEEEEANASEQGGEAEAKAAASAESESSGGDVGGGGGGAAGGSPKPSPVGRERFHLIKKLAARISTRVALSSAAANLEKSDDEEVFEKMEEWVAKAESSVREMTKQAAALLRVYRDRSQTLESAWTRLSIAGSLSYPRCTAAQSNCLTDLLTKAGESAKALSVTEDRHCNRLPEKFEFPVQDLLREVQSFRNALQRRREVQVEYTAKVNRIENRTNALETIRTYPTNRAVNKPQQEQREMEAERQLEEAKETAAAGKVEFEECCNRLKKEAERFQTQFKDKVRDTIKTWADMQMELNHKAEEAWVDLQTSVDSKDVEEDEEELLARERVASF